jgi:hypothetical protein
MTDWTPEEDEAFNDVEKHSNLGKQILRETLNKSSGMDCCTYDCIQGRDCPVRKAKWQGLNEHDYAVINKTCDTALNAASLADIILRNKNT